MIKVVLHKQQHKNTHTNSGQGQIQAHSLIRKSTYIQYVYVL